MPFVDGIYYPPERKKVEENKARTVPQNTVGIVNLKHDVGLVQASKGHAFRHEKICLDN